MKRAIAPLYWAPFGAGGMLSALIGAALVLVTGIAAPLGWLGALDYPRVLAFTHNVIGKLFLVAVIAGFLWHAAHRMYHTLHDLGGPTGVFGWLICYGVALAGAGTAVVAVLLIGF